MTIRKKKTKSSVPIALQYTASGVGMLAKGLYSVVDFILIHCVKNIGRNYALAAIAQIGGPVAAIAKWARYEHFATQNKFSPYAEKRLMEEFSNSYVMADNAPAIEAADKFDTYFKAHIHNIEGFAKTTLTNQAHPDESNAITTAINTALTPNSVTQGVHDDFHAMKIYIQNPKSKYNPTVLADYLQAIYDRSLKALNDQLEADKQAIAALFQDHDFVQNLTTTQTSATNPAPDLGMLEEEMLTSLDEAHTAALEPFQKDMADIFPKLQKEAQKATDELYLLALLYREGSRAQRAKIDALRTQEQEDTLSIEQTNDDEISGSELHGVSLKKLGTLETLTAQTLHYDPGTNRYSLVIPSSLHWYHQNADNQIMPDLMLLALAIKSQGFKTIVMSINHDPGDEPDASEKNPNPTFSHRMGMARDAYKACRLMGWDEACIKIEVNGKELSVNELFSGVGSRLARINKQAGEWAEARKKNMANSNHASMGHFKRHVKETRTTLEAEKQARLEAEQQAMVI